MNNKFNLGDRVFYIHYRTLPFKGVGVVTHKYLEDGEEYIKVSFDNNSYDIKEFTYDGKITKNLNTVLFHSEEECDKEFENLYTPINLEEGETDKFKIFKALIEARDYYNEGWTPSWKNSCKSKAVIEVFNGELKINYSWEKPRTFHFKDENVAEQFLTNYRQYLEKIEDFI